MTRSIFYVVGAVSLFFFLFACKPDKVAEPPQNIKDIIKYNVFDGDTLLQRLYNVINERDVKEVASYFSHSNPLYQKHAVLAFASLQDSTYVPQLIELIESPYAEVRMAAAYAIGQCWATSSETALLDKITALRQDKNADILIQKTLLAALGKSATLKGLHFLAYENFINDTLRIGQAYGIYRAATKPNVNERIQTDSATLMMLEFLTPPKQIYPVRLIASAYFARVGKKVMSQKTMASHQDLFFDVLSNKALNDTRVFVRSNAAQALGAIETKNSEAILYQILEKANEDYRVKISAIRALGQFQPSPKIKKAIGNTLTHENPNVQVAASEILKELARTPDTKLYLEWIAQTTNWRAKANLLAGTIQNHSQEGNQKAISLLASSQNDYEKMALLQALASDEKNITLLLDTLTTTQNHLFRTAALEGLMSMHSLPTFSKKNLAKLYQAIEYIMTTDDVGAMAIASNMLMHEDFKKKYKYSYQFLRKAQNKLELPKEIETYQELEKAIAFITDTKPKATPKPPTKPINWELVKQIDPRKKLTFKTDKGEFTIALFIEDTPISTINFLALTQQGFFTDKYFHRVVPNFVVQAGDPRGDGWGSVDYAIRSEFNLFQYDDEGYLGMASAGKDTESCQFFITHAPTPHLDGRYTIFGKVISGMDVVHRLEIGDKIESVTF